VRTASSEQGRQPQYASGVGYWKYFAEELEPLRISLGDCIERFANLGRPTVGPIERPLNTLTRARVSQDDRAAIRTTVRALKTKRGS
jgi:hypothetical protein